MRKLIYLSTLLLLFVLPMMAQHPLFPTPAKVQNGKGSFVIGKNLQVQGNGGYADKLAAGLQTAAPAQRLCNLIVVDGIADHDGACRVKAVFL